MVSQVWLEYGGGGELDYVYHCFKPILGEAAEYVKGELAVSTFSRYGTYYLSEVVYIVWSWCVWRYIFELPGQVG